MKTNTKIASLYEKLLSTLSTDDYDLSNKYLYEGVSFDKFFITENPAININGKFVTLKVRSVLTSRDVSRINNSSDGIVVTNYKDHFRYGFIPKLEI